MQLYKKVSRSLFENKLVPLDFDIQKFINEKPNADYYESLYRYTEAHKKQFDETKSLAGIKDVTTNKLVFDFDSKETIDAARKDAVELCSRLMTNGVPADQIQASYSGSKGFHVELLLTEDLTRKELENTVKNLAGDLATFDPKIVDEQRVFRISMTKHPKSGLYKIPLNLNELAELPIETIQNKAKDPFKDVDMYFDLMDSWGQVELPDSIKKLRKIKQEEKKELDENIVLEERPEFNRRPKHMTPAKFALAEGFFEGGERHEAYMILASTYRSQGYNKEIAYNMLKATNRLQSRRTNSEPFSTDELWKNIVEYVYSPRWKGGNYAENENALLQKTIKKYNIAEAKDSRIVGIQDVSRRFETFAENIDKNRIYTGIKYIDEDVMLTTGMMVGWLGAPSSGKTSNVLNILENANNSGLTSMFQSLDMYDALLFTRLLQKYVDYDMMKIMDMVKNRQPDKKLRTAWDMVYQNFNKVGFNFQSGPTIEDISNNVDEFQQKTGEKVKLLAVDYLEKIHGPYSDSTANSAFIASRLSDLAKDKDLCLLLLLQPQKSAGDPSDPLLSMRKVKGASVIEQDMRVIFTNWRPGFNPDNDNIDDKYVSIAVVKNNMGPVGKYDFVWDGVSGRIREMSGDEEVDFNRVVEAQKARKETTKDSIF